MANHFAVLAGSGDSCSDCEEQAENEAVDEHALSPTLFEAETSGAREDEHAAPGELLVDCSAQDARVKRAVENATVRRRRPLRYQYYCVIDFECTCDKDNSLVHEVIEFPAVFLNAETFAVDYEFHRYVRPTEQPKLTKFCRALTGIEQEQVSSADELEKVLMDFHGFCDERSLVGRRFPDPGEHSFCIATDGPWDVCKFLRPECERKKIQLHAVWERVCNVRREYHREFNMRGGVRDMLTNAGLHFEGREHSGIDDARNIARLVGRLLRAGVDLKADYGTATWREHRRR